MYSRKKSFIDCLDSKGWVYFVPNKVWQAYDDQEIHLVPRGPHIPGRFLNPITLPTPDFTDEQEWKNILHDHSFWRKAEGFIESRGEVFEAKSIRIGLGPARKDFVSFHEWKEAVMAEIQILRKRGVSIKDPLSVSPTCGCRLVVCVRRYSSDDIEAMREQLIRDLQDPRQVARFYRRLKTA